jgi:hypothetical protein
MSIFPANAKLTFTVGNGTFTTDPVSHNQVEGQSSVTVTAYLKQKNKPNLQEVPGVDPTSSYCEGRTVSPKFMPAKVKPQSWADAVVTDLATGQKMTGRFFVLFTLESPFKAVAKTLGSSISGYFVQSGG